MFINIYVTKIAYLEMRIKNDISSVKFESLSVY